MKRIGIAKVVVTLMGLSLSCQFDDSGQLVAGGDASLSADASTDGPPPGSDAGGMDAGSSDAASVTGPFCPDGTCDPGETAENCAADCGTCDPACSNACCLLSGSDIGCSGGTTCQLDCDPDAACDQGCSGGSTCYGDCRGASACDAVCSGGSSCTVNCADLAGQCFVTCSGGSLCLLNCAGAAGACGFAQCDAPQDCGNGVQVCNRPCP